MANAKPGYGLASKKEKSEYFDTAEELSKKLDQLAEWVTDSKHVIIFTGAGISTSTGIPDFRSGMDTVLPTGPGKWELRDHGVRQSKASKTKSTLQAIPSPTHMAIVQLQKEGILKFVVSQNTDGLHLRSGLHAEALAELHGNTNLEICEKCNERYLRDFRTRTSIKVHNHYTGRLCDVAKCKGKLKDSIINFGEDLPDKELISAFFHAEKADLCICLGSSLRVSPANEIPRLVAMAGNRVVIGNLQKTPLDKKASLTVHAMCDDVMSGLMHRLNIPIPKWELIRRVKFTVAVVHSEVHDNKLKLKASLTGLDVTKDIPYSIFQKVHLKIAFDGEELTVKIEKEPFTAIKTIELKDKNNFTILASAEMFFHGHYGEPPFQIEETLTSARMSCKRDSLLYYDPAERKWRCSDNSV